MLNTLNRSLHAASRSSAPCASRSRYRPTSAKIQGLALEDDIAAKEKEWEGPTAEVVGGRSANGAFCPACAITGVVSGSDCKRKMKGTQKKCEKSLRC